MPVLKFQISTQRSLNLRLDKITMQRRWQSFCALSLLVAMSLSGCAASSLSLKEEPKMTPIDSVIDVSAWRSDIKRLSNELTELLNSVQKTTNKSGGKNGERRPVK